MVGIADCRSRIQCIVARCIYRLIHNGVVRRVLYEEIMVMCYGYGTLVQAPTMVIDEWFGLGTLSLKRIWEPDSVLTLSFVARVVAEDRAVLPDQ